MSRKQPKRVARPGVDEFGRTELHHAARDADLPQVQALLAAGADANAADDNGWQPLHFGAQARSAEICEALLSAGAEVDSRDSYGNTPLWRAVFNSQGQGEVIATLRRFGADPLATNSSGVSPVELARSIANFDIVRHFTDV